MFNTQNSRLVTALGTETRPSVLTG